MKISVVLSVMSLIVAIGLSSAAFGAAIAGQDANPGVITIIPGGIDAPSVTALAFSPDGKFLAVGLIDPKKPIGTIRLVNVATGTFIRTMGFEHNGNVTSIAFSPDGRALASGGQNDQFVVLSDIHTGLILKKVPVKQGTVKSLAFTPSGKTLAAGLSLPDITDTGIGGRVDLFAYPECTLRKSIFGMSNAISALGFSSDGLKLVTTSGKIDLWDTLTGKSLWSQTGDSHAVALSPDGLRVISGMGMWNVATGTQLTDSLNEPESLCFSKDGSIVVGGSEAGGVRVWDGFSGKELRVLDIFGDRIVVSPDGKLVAVGSINGALDLGILDKMSDQSDQTAPQN